MTEVSQHVSEDRRRTGGSPSARWIPVVAVALAVLATGCLFATDGGDVVENSTEDDDPFSFCDKASSSDPHGHAHGHSAEVGCREMSGPGQQQISFDCPNPQRSRVDVVTNLTAGSVTVRAFDAASTKLFEKSYERTGPSNESTRIDEGETGNWTIQAERSETFEGSFRAVLLCGTSATEDGHRTSWVR